MATLWLTLVGETAVLFGITAGITAWVRSRYVTPSEQPETAATEA